jgi:hypothetical protein
VRVPAGETSRLTIGYRALLAASLITLVAPAAAAAHLRSGVIAVDYRAHLAIPTPKLGTALAARIYQSDLAIRLDVRDGHSVVVLGYLDEPFLRLDRRGLAVNASSPTAASAVLLAKAERLGGSRVVWRGRGRRRSVVWHDARTRGASRGNGVANWTIPLVVDGRRAALAGSTERVGRPAAWPWLVACGVALGALLAALAAHRRRRGLLGEVALAGALIGVAAMITSAIGFAADRYASGFAWFVLADELALATVGVAILTRGPGPARHGSAAGLGLLALAGSGLGGGALFHGVVLSALPAPAARAAVALGLAAGALAAVAGTVSLFSEAELLRVSPAGRSS